MPDFGESYFSENYRNYEAQNPARKLSHYHARVASRVQGPARALDVGCGLGLWADHLARAEPEWAVSAIDVDPEVIAHNAAKFPEVDFMVGRAGEGRIDRRFDLVTAMDVLEHVPGVEEQFEKICGWLEPGGLFAFVVPVYDGPLGPLVHLLDSDPTHIHKWGRERWLGLASRHLTDVRWHGLFRLLLPTNHYIHMAGQRSRRISPAIFVSGLAR